jgi:hypothetical protein
MDDKLKKELEKLFQALLEAQEPLGEEFEKVLYENLWELYERD